MDDKLTMEIKNLRFINDAKIEINKINIIGGVNGSGKSTASQVLYSFLKSNCSNRKDYLINEIVNKSNMIRKYLIEKGADNEVLLDKFSIKENYSDILDRFKKIEKIYGKYQKFINECCSESTSHDNYHDMAILNINQLINYYSSENDGPQISKKIMWIIARNEHIYEFRSNIFEYGILLKFNVNSKGQNINAFDYFFERGCIDSVFYIDNISLLNLLDINSKTQQLHITEFINSLESIKVNENLLDDGYDEIKNNCNVNILMKIEDLLKGYFVDSGTGFFVNFRDYNDTYLRNKFKHLSKDEFESGSIGIKGNVVSSGMQQIGIIQILLLNGLLKENGYLILDEPEVNLHPEWQFKFAEILVLLVKELNITLYINSHSPMFIEAMEVLTLYYDLEDETNFYLTEKQDNGKYNFVKVGYDNLYELYDNLAKPYDAIEVYRLKAEYKKGNY